jgi:circadian clock protein KaiC
MVSEIVRKAMDDEPAIVVIDSVKMLRDHATAKQLRAALYRLMGAAGSAAGRLGAW